MASTLWIHCNLCYYLFYRKDRKFYQLSCLHVFCKDCMAQSNRGTICPVCKRQGIKFVEICNAMDNKVKTLYAPNTSKSIELASTSINFQKKQKQHLISQLIATVRTILMSPSIFNNMTSITQYLKEEKLEKTEQFEQILRQKIYEYQQKYIKVRAQRRSMQDALRKQVDSSPEITPKLQRDRNKRQTDFFESNSESINSDRSKRTSSSRNSSDSFLNLKGVSTSSESIHSVNFGTTPSSGPYSAGGISDLFYGMKIGHR
ncbi:RING finger protein vilya isoform X1 [Malaya genurostris]|uniref:RING finger protein vilya isoform X1 n=1 Tax=Malaya genurostris TaxID=325434 RepID=UPI0026F3C37D|nr:RING finger protein vilya isoform X1 [Malaya genurostris]